MIRYSLIIFFCGTALYGAQTFLVKEPPLKRQTGQQLRQQITEIQGMLLEQQAMVIEQSARIQQKLGKLIRETLEGSTSQGASQSIKDLKKQLNLFHSEQARLKEQAAAQERFLKVLG